jgi:hypothetical protein
LKGQAEQFTENPREQVHQLPWEKTPRALEKLRMNSLEKLLNSCIFFSIPMFFLSRVPNRA